MDGVGVFYDLEDPEALEGDAQVGHDEVGVLEEALLEVGVGPSAGHYFGAHHRGCVFHLLEDVEEVLGADEALVDEEIGDGDDALFVVGEFVVFGVHVGVIVVVLGHCLPPRNELG